MIRPDLQPEALPAGYRNDVELAQLGKVNIPSNIFSKARSVDSLTQRSV